jgi:hypothetical protein
MWVRKAESEIRQERGRKILKNFYIFFILFLCLLIIPDKFGICMRYGYCHPSLDWPEIYHRLPLYFAIASVFAFFASHWKHNETMICLKCERAKFKDSNTACACGGTFEDLEKVKWVEKSAANP